MHFGTDSECKLISTNSAVSQKRIMLDDVSQGTSDEAKVKRKTRTRTEATGEKAVLQGKKLSRSQCHRLPGVGRSLPCSEVAGTR